MNLLKKVGACPIVLTIFEKRLVSNVWNIPVFQTRTDGMPKHYHFLLFFIMVKKISLKSLHAHKLTYIISFFKGPVFLFSRFTDSKTHHLGLPIAEVWRIATFLYRNNALTTADYDSNSVTQT